MVIIVATEEPMSEASRYKAKAEMMMKNQDDEEG